MTPYPHPAASLAVFKSRLDQDTGIAVSYTLQCGKPIPIEQALEGSACSDWVKTYNTVVDLGATGNIVGEVLQYPYNRLDIAKFTLPAKTFEPYLKGDAVTVVDLLDEFNKRSGLFIPPEDVVAYELPDCDCNCEPIGIKLEINSDSLLFVGTLTLYVWGDDLWLSDAIKKPFMGCPILPDP